MEVILSSQEMRHCDRYAIEKLRIPGFILMENAGRSVADSLQRHLGEVSGRRFLVCCGKGNNGGDGFVVARHLLNRGATVAVALSGNSSNLAGDAKWHFKMLRTVGRERGGHTRFILLEKATPGKLATFSSPDAIVDALFGTGFSGPTRDPFSGLIGALNQCACPVFSIDIPSGLNSDDGSVASVAVKATVTITLGAKKTGLLVGAGPEYSGIVEVGDISLPSSVVQRKASAQTFLIERKDVARVMPQRPFHAHKHSVGKIFVLAGSPGLTGAAALASHAALRIGAGAVVLATPKSVYEILAKKLTEVMVAPLDETEDGTIGRGSLSTIEKYLAWADIVVIGPGLGRNATTDDLLRELIRKRNRPMVLDADGLNAVESRGLKKTVTGNGELILTPHIGEFSRVTGIDADEAERNRLQVAREFAMTNRITLVLKGAPTVTATPGGDVYINPTGNAGMATAGSGDVLSGCIGGLLGQGMSGADAAYSGVYLHGLAGDLAKNEFGEKSMIAGDIMKFLPAAVKLTEGRRAR